MPEPKSLEEIVDVEFLVITCEDSVGLRELKKIWLKRSLKSYAAWVIKEAEPRHQNLEKAMETGYSDFMYAYGKKVGAKNYKQNLKKLIE